MNVSRYFAARPTRRCSRRSNCRSNLTATMLVQCKIAGTMEKAKARSHRCTDSGEALNRFRQNIELQGGDPKVCDKPELLIDERLTEDRHNRVMSNGYLRKSIPSPSAVRSVTSAAAASRPRTASIMPSGMHARNDRRSGQKRQTTWESFIAEPRSRSESISEKLQSAYKISREITRTTKLIRATV